MGVVALFFGVTIVVSVESVLGIFLVVIGLLLLICQGAFETWRKDQERWGKTINELNDELDELKAQKAALKPIHPDHAAVLKDILQEVERSVRELSAIDYGPGSAEQERLYQDAFDAHFPELSAYVPEWTRLVKEKDAAVAAVNARTHGAFDQLNELGFVASEVRGYFFDVLRAQPRREWATGSTE